MSSIITHDMRLKYLDAENFYRNKMTGREREDAYAVFMQQWIDPNPNSLMADSNYNDFIWWLSTQDYESIKNKAPRQ